VLKLLGGISVNSEFFILFMLVALTFIKKISACDSVWFCYFFQVNGTVG